MAAAVTDAYATAEQYRTATTIDSTGSDDDIVVDLGAISRYMEKRLGRFFTKDAADVARQFYTSHTGALLPEAENPWKLCRGERVLQVDDMSAAPTTVKVDENADGVCEKTYAIGTDCVVWPMNALKGPEPKPYTALFIPDWTTKSLNWPPARLVDITAKWGWPSVPGAIQRGCIHLTAILRLETPRAKNSMSEIGEVLGTSKQANAIIDELIRHYGRVTI